MDKDGFEDLFERLKADLRSEEQDNDGLANLPTRSLNSSSDYPPNAGSLEKFPPVGDSSPFYFKYHEENTYNDNDGELFTWAPERVYRSDLISFCEEYYHENHKLPGPKELQLRFAGYPECPRYLKDWPKEIERAWGPGQGTIRQALEIRGLFVGNEPVGDYPVGFVSAVHLILNYNDKRTVSAKLKGLGITSATWAAWLKKPHCRNYYREHCEDLFSDEFVAESQRNLMASVSAGDLQAIKYYNEITGVYRPQESATQNVIATLFAGLFEILAKHLSQDLIAEIGAEIREAPAIKRVMGAIEAETHEYHEGLG